MSFLSPILKGKSTPHQGTPIAESGTPELFEQCVAVSKVKLQIGGGHSGDDWINIDPAHGQSQWKRQAQQVPWPLEDNSVDVMLASHVMEHIPAGQERIDVMNEAWRVLKPGHLLCIMVPILCDENMGVVYYTSVADPTHVSYWVQSSFGYFDGSINPGADYGIKRWKTMSYDTGRFAWEGRWLGTPVKD